MPSVAGVRGALPMRGRARWRSLAVEGIWSRQGMGVARRFVILGFAACSVLAIGAPPAFADVSCANDALRTGFARSLSDCRAYEMVSPLDKNGGSIERDAIEVNYATSGSSPNGDAVAYASSTQFAGVLSGAPFSQYRSIRGANGWQTRGISPRLATDGPTNTPLIQLLSSDLLKVVVQTNASLTPGADALLGGSRGLYLQDDSGSSTQYELVSRPASPLSDDDVIDKNLASTRFAPAGASADFKHIVFNSAGRQLTPDGAGPGALDNSGVYEWVDGQVRFVSVLPDGSPSVNAVAGARWMGQVQEEYAGDHLISDDGQRVFFTGASPPGPSRLYLYVREAGTTTRLISGSERTGDNSDVPQGGVFQTAKADDGALALFTSSDRLTDDAKAVSEPNLPDLYLWNASAAAGHHLTDLTTADEGGGGVLAVAAASDDLSHVYFVATGSLVLGAPAGQPKLYLWTPADGVRLVATLTDADSSLWSVRRSRGNAVDPVNRDARATPDGSRMLFTSTSPLTSYDTAGHRAVYLYDASSGDITCVSCSSLAASATGDAHLFPIGQRLPSLGSVSMPYRLPRNLSEDGQRVFFETTQKLVPGDTNGLADVYEWTAEGGLNLVSTGQGDLGAQFIDASSDGRDVFFTTQQRLVSFDIDDQIDIYDARMGGGFAEPVVPQPCAADACQGPLSIPPALSTPATTTLRGSGNVVPSKAKKAKKCRRGFAKKRVRGKVRCVKKPKKHGRKGHR
jgi:hypothetical protein